METIKRIAFIFGISIAATICSHGAQGLPLPMKGLPPKADEIGDVLFDSSCIAKTVYIGRDAVLNYLRMGEFLTFLRKGVPPELMSPDEEDGGFKYYSGGCFATKQGKVFRFHPVNSRVLEVTGLEGGGFFVIKDRTGPSGKQNAEPAGAGQPATQPADKVPAKIQPSTPTPKDGPR